MIKDNKISIIGAIDVPKLLTELQCRPADISIPTTATCPLCRTGRLNVYRDLVTSGGWLVCAGCRWVGNPVDLVKRVWKLNDNEVIDKLQVCGLIVKRNPSLAAYQLIDHTSNLCSQTWDSLTDWVKSAAIVDRQLRAFNMHAEVTNGWENTVGRWVRGFTNAELKQAQFLRRVKQNAGDYNGLLMSHVPHGHKEFALLPLEDVPGRPIGFRLLYGDGHTNNTIIAIRSKVNTLIYGLQHVLETKDDYVVLTPDIHGVLDLQLQSIRQFGRNAPIAGLLLNTQPNPIWRQVKKQTVFWYHELTPGLFREAVHADGRIYIKQGKLPNMASVVNQLAHIKRNSLTWQEAIDNHLQQITPEQGYDFLRVSGLDSDKVAEIVEGCSTAVQEKLRPLRKTDPYTVNYGNQLLRRNGTCIYNADGIVSDVIPLVERIYDREDPIYEGRIVHRHVSIPFKARMSKLITQAGYYYVVRKLASRGLVPFVLTQWRSHLFHVGQLFGNPGLVSRQQPLGWDATLQSLVTLDYSLDRFGKISLQRYGKRKLSFGGIHLPVKLSPTVIKRLSGLIHIPVILTAVAQVAATVLSRKYVQPQNMLLYGRSLGDAVRFIARSFQCPFQGIRATTKYAEFCHADFKRNQKNSWPTFTSCTDYGVLAALSRDSDAPTLVAWSENNNITATLLTNYNYAVLPIEAKGLAQFTDIEDILPAYLQDLAERGFNIQCRGDDYLRQVINDVFDWWARIGGISNKSPIWTEDVYWRNVLQLIIQHNKIQYEVCKDGLFLDPELLHKCTKKIPGAMLNISRLANGLIDTGYLKQDTVDGLWMLSSDMHNYLNLMDVHSKKVA